MAIKRLSAVDTGTGYRFTVHLDEEQVLPDPEFIVTVRGSDEAVSLLLASAPKAAVLASGGGEALIHVDTERTIPDPASVMVWDYGKVDGENQPIDPKEAWGLCEVEALAMVESKAQAGKELEL